MNTTDPIRDKKQIKAMAIYYLKKGNLRNHLLIVMGVQTGLRISDLLRLTRGDVYSYESGQFLTHLSVTEHKTGKKKRIAINRRVLAALELVFQDAGSAKDYLFQSNRKKRAPIGRVQAWRIVKEAALAVGVQWCIGCYSMRKSLGYHAWQSGVEAVLIMDIYNHSNFSVTKRYLGISQDERDKVYLELMLA